ncbi:hypothetical protein RJ639_020112 [Escallonia herrerae]|uniref:Patatin n=1 Tax=Escallonia herrerae TaxID=1293975 RepID=A0AA88V8P3_9ASTE|nr:hypothetical protein RJ639_020112 [Escallonia herrerae]
MEVVSEGSFLPLSLLSLNLNFRGVYGKIRSLFRSLTGPKYDGKYLCKLIREELGAKRLSDTLTNVVIPTFDITNLQPIVENSPSLDALLSDICISTSAAPTYLPAHYFKNEGRDGNVQEFNLIDGGIAANNPVKAAARTL